MIDNMDDQEFFASRPKRRLRLRKARVAELDGAKEPRQQGICWFIAMERLTDGSLKYVKPFLARSDLALDDDLAISNLAVEQMNPEVIHKA